MRRHKELEIIIPYAFRHTMENLLRQARVRFSGQQSKEEFGKGKEMIQSQNDSSFNGDKKSPQNWIRRQFAGQMNQGYDSNEAEQATSLAAAVYVIVSAEESSIPEQNKISGGSEPSFSRSKSKKSDKAASVQRRASKEFSAKSPDSRESRMPEIANTKEEAPTQGIAPPAKKTLTFPDKPAPSVKKMPTFSGRSLSSGGDVKSETAEPKATQPTVKPEIQGPKPDIVAKTKRSTSTDKTERQTSSAPPRVGQTKADIWERDEVAKIQKRYEELNATIRSWENKKKQRARDRRDKTESELTKVRLRAEQRFQNKIASIDEIAEAARAQSAERQRNEELKAKAKANNIRKTGEIPKTFLCF